MFTFTKEIFIFPEQSKELHQLTFEKATKTTTRDVTQYTYVYNDLQYAVAIFEILCNDLNKTFFSVDLVELFYSKTSYDGGYVIKVHSDQITKLHCWMVENGHCRKNVMKYMIIE
jgi:hypothetical protein